jgi:mRNA interferase HigB
MRIVAKSTLKEFWEIYPDAEKPLRAWYEKIKGTDWESPYEIKQIYGDADNVGNGRIVFNIGGNKYRLIVLFIYEIKICYIRFIGTHKEYDKIKDIENI